MKSHLKYRNYCILTPAEEIDSTYSYLNRRVEKEGMLPTPTVVLASSQTRGRGQGTNLWYSSPGANLLPSIYFNQVDIPIEAYWRLSEMAAVALWQTIIHFTKCNPTDLRIKWPNDIVYRGHKVAGILIGNSFRNQKIAHTIIGIGLNVNEKNFPSDLPPAHSMYTMTGLSYDLSSVLFYLLDSLDNLFAQRGEEAEMAQLHTTYQDLLFLKGMETSFRDVSTGRTFDAFVDSVTEDGLLQLSEKIDSSFTKHSYRVREVEYFYKKQL